MLKALAIGISALAGFALVAPLVSANAAAGSLDPTFGNGGKVVTSLPSCGLSACSTSDAGAVLQPDGKIVVAVNAFNVAGALRYLPSGRLDLGFGIRGKAAFVASLGETGALTLQPDGKIVIAGINSVQTNNFFTVDRYNVNGTLDSEFGNGGVATAALGGGQGVGEAVLIQADGKILIAATALVGHLGTPDTALARFNPDGSLDTTFGVGGTALAAAASGASAVAELFDGEILVINGSKIAQFTGAGTLEATVTGGAIEASSPPGTFLADGHFFDPTRLPTGKFTGSAQVLEFNPDGSTDTAFNNSAFEFASGNLTSNAQSTAFDADGKVLVGGSSSAGIGSAAKEVNGLARLDTNGNLDPAFGAGGAVTTAFPAAAFGCDQLLIQSDGAIVAVGTIAGPNAADQTNVALVRYLAD